MLDGKVCVCVLVVSPEASQGCHDHSVLEGDVAKLDGLEEVRGGHCDASSLLTLFSCLGSLLSQGVPFYIVAQK
jgi:hypothetical protein